MDEKTLKRSARDVWGELRRERRARAKLLTAADLVQSADRITEIAAKLRALADDARALENTAPSPAEPANDGAPEKKPKKRRAKKTAKRAAAKSTAKSKKKKKS